MVSVSLSVTVGRKSQSPSYTPANHGFFLCNGSFSKQVPIVTAKELQKGAAAFHKMEEVAGVSQVFPFYVQNSLVSAWKTCWCTFSKILTPQCTFISHLTLCDDKLGFLSSLQWINKSVCWSEWTN